ncbi:hypothetical protein Tco_0193190, partial [Tanacetum coccineum]
VDGVVVEVVTSSIEVANGLADDVVGNKDDGSKECELLASSCNLDGFDDKLGEVTVRGLKVNLRKNRTLDGVVMDGEPIFVKADKECFIEMALDPQ